MRFTKDEILSVLEPQGCAYSTGECCELIEVPQNAKELQTVIENVTECEFKEITHDEAKELGYTTLAEWSNENDYLFLSEDEYFLLCLPKSLFQEKAA